MINWFLDEWDPDLKKKFHILPYEEIPRIKTLKPAIFIFSDLDRINGNKTIQHNAEKLAELIEIRFDPSLIINHPKQVLLRFDLLKTLSEKGINDYGVYPFTDDCDHIKFPVFVRRANDHKGPVTDLISDKDAYLATYSAFSTKYSKNQLDQFMVIEFCDTQSQDNFFRKYSAFIFGENVMPAHVVFNRHWIAKETEHPILSEINNYLQANPHGEQLQKVAKLANTQYGRIDYGILNGRIQIWEINTNPILVKKKEEYSEELLPVKRELVGKISQQFLGLTNRLDPLSFEGVEMADDTFMSEAGFFKSLLKKITKAS